MTGSQAENLTSGHRSAPVCGPRPESKIGGIRATLQRSTSIPLGLAGSGGPGSGRAEREDGAPGSARRPRRTIVAAAVALSAAVIIPTSAKAYAADPPNDWSFYPRWPVLPGLRLDAGLGPAGDLLQRLQRLRESAEPVGQHLRLG